MQSHKINLQLWAGNPDLPQPAEPVAPHPLVLHSYVQSYHVLPIEGGILDQPTDMWMLINAAGAAEGEWRAIQDAIAANFNK